MRNRADTIGRLTSGDVPDILIVGGGINGVGVFRDLAAQGIPSVLVEAGDFASGTSAAPSRLIHGGLRYLETGEAKLVKESLIERNLLLQNAHHVVHPQPIWVPITHYLAGAVGAVARFLHLTTRPGPKGAIPVKIGLVLYDLFGKFHQTMPNHRMLSGRAARAEMPVLSKDVVAVGEYYDAFITHPERLVMELIADAEADCPEAFAIPYLAAGEAKNGVIELVDRIEQKSYEIRPRTVINAAGAWVDRVQEGLGFSDKLMGGTRGTHLVMLKPELTKKLGGKMLYFETADHRACLALPMDDRHVYVGTTDIRVEDPDERYYTEEEIDYIFDVLKPVLPGETFDRSEIVFAMGGVRPLPKQQTAVTGQISRDHRIDELAATGDRPFETVVLVGGKWTTYRAFAEQVTDVILGYRDAERQRSTGDLVIGGARDFPSDAAARDLWIADLAKETGLDPDRCRVLAARYGSTARRYAEAEAAASGLIPGFDAYSRAEIMDMCRTERVTRLQDIVLRRTLMAFEGGLSLDKLRAVGEVAAAALDWDAARQASELDDVAELLRVKHRVDLE